MAFKVTSRFLVFWVCCVPLSLHAQQEETVPRIYLMKDGLPTEGVNCAIQDSHGFIWLGTYSGLVKFDGYRYTNYRNNPESSNSLRSNLVHSLVEDDMGRLWIGHSNGVDLFDPRTEKFYLHWPDSGDHKNAFTARLRKRKDGRIWICTYNGVYVADPKTLNIERSPQYSRHTYDIAETRDGSVVAASSEWGVYYVDAKTGEASQFTHDQNNPKSIGDQFSRSVIVDIHDRIWIGTRTSLELFNPQEKSFTHYPTKTEVLCIMENPDGKLVLGCHDGRYMFDPENGGKLDKLPGNGYTQSVIRDRQGIVWTSSLRGLQQFNPNHNKFNIYRHFGTHIGDIVEDLNHELWIAVKDQEIGTTIIRLSQSLGRVYDYPRSLPDRRQWVWSLFCNKTGHVWLASQWNLEKYNPESRTFHSVGIDRSSAIEPIKTFMDSYGTIWAGGWDGLARFDAVTGRSDRLPAFPASIVYSFLEDSSRNLWVGSTAGLTRINLKTGKIDVFNNRSNDPQSLSNNIVYHLMMDSDKNIWVGTGGGLNKMIKGTENDIPRFLNWRTTQSGLPNDDVYCVVDGGDGTLWMTCGNIISHFYPEQNSFRNYDSNDGLSGRNFRAMSYLNGKGLRSQNGNILFGSVDGLVVFHPDSLHENRFVPPVVISGFSIWNQAVPVMGTDADTLTWKTPLTQSISYTDEIQLTYDQHDFNLEFAALNFINPEHNQYKYKLEPYEKEWIETNTDNRFAHYTNISPGKYTFRVIASNNDGVWNEEGATLTIIIVPPWWQTWWAYSLYGVAIVCLLIAGRRIVIQRERHVAESKLKHVELEKVREINKVKTHFFANISHEFRTPITLLLGPLKDLYDHSTSYDQRSLFGTMLRNAQRLLRLVNQLLDLSRLEAGKMKLRASGTDLVQFLNEIASSYESLATGKHVKFVFRRQVEKLFVYVDQEKLEKIVHNLLSNAFKFTNEGGEVVLNLKVVDSHAAIVVKDTGIGIAEDELGKVFDRFYQVDSSQTRGYEGSGLGMALAKELVELHHGTISVESKEGSGSTFTVRLPLGTGHLRREEILDGDLVKTVVNLEELVALENTASNGNGKEKATVSSDQPVVLIVEDNADMRHYIVKTLSGLYQIIEAENGKAGAAIAKESLPDLIISDIMMPETDGYKLCELIKCHELTSHIPVILLTARADRNSKLSGLNIGVDDYLSKPFDAEELKLIVRNRIVARKKMQERFSREITLEPRQIAITSLEEKFLTKILAIIEEHMDDENFSIDELSREAGYSNMHFYRKIKALAGQTPSQFLRTIRLKRAAELLSKNSDNVTQIAFSVGFSSLSYFNKCFKEQFGVTPGQFEAKSKV